MQANIFEAIQNMGYFTDVRESSWLFPIILSTHLACIAVFGGMILVTDLRLLGLMMTEIPVSDFINRLRPWKWLGFIIMIFCGISIGGAKAVSYYANPYFLTKMTLLLLIGVNALVFRKSVYRNTAELDRLTVMPGNAKLAATLSLVLWMGVLSCGRWIAYYEPICKPGEDEPGCEPPTLQNKSLLTSPRIDEILARVHLVAR